MEEQLKDLFGRFQWHFGIKPGLGPSSNTCLLKTNGIQHSIIKSLYWALDTLYRQHPWKHLQPGHLLRDSNPSNKKRPFSCAQFLGGGSGDLALHMFKSEQDAVKVSSSEENKPVPNVEILRIIFQKESLLSSLNKRMVALMDLESSGIDHYPSIDVACSSSDGDKVRFREPTMVELRYLIAFIWAITRSYPFSKLDTDTKTRSVRNLNIEPFIQEVDVLWSPVRAAISQPRIRTVAEKKLPGNASEEDYLFDNFQKQFGTRPGIGSSTCKCLLKIDGISLDFIRYLYQTLAVLYRQDPWKRLQPKHLFGVRVGVNRQFFPVAQFIGWDGGDLGLHLYRSEQDALKVSLPLEIKPVPDVQILRVIFQKKSHFSEWNKTMINIINPEQSGRNQYPIIDVACGNTIGTEVCFRDPMDEELKYLIAAIRGMIRFYPLFELHSNKVARNYTNWKIGPFSHKVYVLWPDTVASSMDRVLVTIFHPPRNPGEKKLQSQTPEPKFGPRSGVCLLNIDGISNEFIKHLYRALAVLYYEVPWKHFGPGHLFGIRVGRNSDWSNKKQLFPCAQFIGGYGGQLGLYLFKSKQDALRVNLPVYTKPAPNVEFLRVNFEKGNILSVSNKRMVILVGIEPCGRDQYPIIDVARSSSNGGKFRFRDLTMEESRYLIAFIKAIGYVYPMLELDKDSVTTTGGNMKPFIKSVKVLWPPELQTIVAPFLVTISHPPKRTLGELKLRKPRRRNRPKKLIEYLEPIEEEEEVCGVKQCAMCDKVVELQYSLSCSHCESIIYCGSTCQKNHWRAAHKEICGLCRGMMKREKALALKIFKFNLVVDNWCEWLESMGLHKKGMWRRICGCYSDCPVGLLPGRFKRTSDVWDGLEDKDYPADQPVAIKTKANGKPVSLSGWSEYYHIRSLPLTSPVAAILSHPLTVYRILTNVVRTKNRLIKGKGVVVHYLGPGAELDWIQTFKEISHLLNGLGPVKIDMVGPEVPCAVMGPVAAFEGQLTITLVRGLYQDQYRNLPAPHLVIALNCELAGYSSWSGALEVIKAMKVPAYFTERSEILCPSAEQVIWSSGLCTPGQRVGYWANPFRSPLREQMPSNNLPAFSNGFIIGVDAELDTSGPDTSGKLKIGS